MNVLAISGDGGKGKIIDTIFNVTAHVPCVDPQERRGSDMGLGPYLFIAWAGVFLASLSIAGVHLVRRRLQGVGAALAAVTGALLSWALMVAYIGACEIDGYAGGRAFMVFLAVGIAGVALLTLSCIRLAAKPDKAQAADA